MVRKVLKFTLLTVCVVMLMLSIIGKIWYLKMIYNDGVNYGGYNPLYYAMLLFKISMILLALTIVLIITVLIFKKFRIELMFGLGGNIVLIFATIFLSIIIWLFIFPSIDSFLNGYREYVKTNVKMEPIIKWLNENKSEDRYLNIDELDWPDEIKILSPSFVEIFKSDNGGSYVQVSCGGGFESWGIIVDPEYSLIKFDEPNISENKMYPLKEKEMSIVMIKKGFYVWVGP